jgi:ubiquinone/menaquinone biosynthesis C-methylase UbiE
MTDEHTHHQNHHHLGVRSETLFAASMLVGRGGMARVVERQAGLSRRDVVVDVGCGPGVAVRRARRGGAAQAIGIDPGAQMLRLARWISTVLRADNVRFLEGSAEQLPLDAATATVVWAIQSVHHWSDRARGLTESLRVLVPGGRLILLERFVTPGARGLAAHGLGQREADDLAAELGRIGFANVVQRLVPLGRRRFVLLTADVPTT